MKLARTAIAKRLREWAGGENPRWFYMTADEARWCAQALEGQANRGEVTNEMIEAGVAALANAANNPSLLGDDEICQRIYTAMRQARSQSKPVEQKEGL